MNRLALAVVCAAAWCAALTACGGGPDMGYTPQPQLLPGNIQKIALHPIVNNTEQFGMEDKLLLKVRDQFLSDTRYPLVPEAEADGVVWITISRYILTPITFDPTLAPTSYKLRIAVDVSMVPRGTNQALWEEKNLEGELTFSAATQPNGITEEQAREKVYAFIAPKVVTRVIDGFGAVTGTSQRRLDSDAPSTAPPAQPQQPIAPAVPAPY